MSEWRIFDLEITAESPLHLGDESKNSNFLQTRTTIAGANLRGLVAKRTLAACTQTDFERDHANCPDREDCPFWQIFGGELEPLFGPAYPGKSGPAYPFPLTARTCKLYPGYDAGDKKTYHEVYDIMLDQFIYGLLSDPRFPHRSQLQPALDGALAALETSPRDACPMCDQSLTPAEGTYVRGERGVPGHAGRPSVRRATHVGINRARGVAEDGLLFTLETIEPISAGAVFHGSVVVPEARADVLREHLKGKGYVGRGRSRGLGQVNLWVRQERTSIGDLTQRLESFQRAVRAVLGAYTSQDERIEIELPGTLFSVTLHSPAILESFGRPRVKLESEWLGLPEARLLQAWARTEIITGWDGAARLQRRTRLGIQAGSVFLYWAPPDQKDQEGLEKRLTEIELLGVGEERARGYGQVSVCDPFHVHKRLGAAQEERSG